MAVAVRSHLTPIIRRIRRITLGNPTQTKVYDMTNETERAGLLPCPFCGGEAEFKPYKKDGLTIKCKSFGCVRRDQRVLRQSIDWLREAMAKDWNTRTNPPPVDAADDEESICQFTPGHSEFESRQVFAPSAVPLIVRGCCESEPADPDSPDTICINALDLEGIVASHLGAVILRDDPIPQVRQSPADTAVVRDATRYRWLRTHFKFANDSTREIWFDGDTLVDEPSELDESIDVAITAQQQESGHE